MGRLAILVPMWRRAHRVAPLVASIQEATPDARIVFLCSPDDPEVVDVCGRAPADLVVMDYPGGTVGDYARKINLGARLTDEAHLFCGADDLVFHQQWYELCARHLERPGIGVVGTNDLGNRRTFRGPHSTHSLVSRAYMDDRGTVDEVGKILHEGYWHEFVDDELIRTATARGAFVHERHAYVEHLHPHWGKAPSDASYEMQDERMVQGRALFEQRQRLWGGTA